MSKDNLGLRIYFYSFKHKLNGPMPEWLMGTDCKSVGYTYAGSNPARPIQKLD